MNKNKTTRGNKMMDADAIRSAKDIDEVVEIINRSKKDYSTGNDTRDAECMAGQYAWDAAESAGYITDSDIEAHLDFLVEEGAEFDFCESFEHALVLKEFENSQTKLEIEDAQTCQEILETLETFVDSLGCELNIDVVCEKSLLDAAWFYRDEARNDKIEDDEKRDFFLIADMLEISAEKIKLIK